LIEFIAISGAPEGTSLAWEWAVPFRDAIAQAASRNILPNTYISLKPPEELDLGNKFQDDRNKPVEIKGKYDSSKVHEHALPQFYLVLASAKRRHLAFHILSSGFE
jgi:hypothetical protein